LGTCGWRGAYGGCWGWNELSEGCYLPRTNLTATDPVVLWKQYIQLTEAEWAFRITKDELEIRPIWHQKARRVQAHIRDDGVRTATNVVQARPSPAEAGAMARVGRRSTGWRFRMAISR
jgi:hypothetical protein